ncbi:TetR/AcrR family transcriptional regulator [Nocardioides dilutus]
MAGRPNEQRRADTRRAILDAAWTLCREQGLTQLSLRELARRVGMRAPSLYSYFPAKDAIYDAMFADGQRQMAEALAFLPTENITRADFRTGVRAFFDFCVEDPVRYQLMFQRTIPGFVPSPESYALAVQRIDEVTQQLEAAGVTEQRHVDLWTGIIAGLTAQQLANEPGGDRWARLVDEAVDLFCDHVGIPADTATPGRKR